MNASLNRQLSSNSAGYARQQEEVLVADERSGLSPSQMVERKLIGLLRGNALSVSQLLTANRHRGLS